MTPPPARLVPLYHFCRLQAPGVALTPGRAAEHFARTHGLYQAKQGRPVDPDEYLAGLYALDWYVCCACLDSDRGAWQALFATRTGRSDTLLSDALRGRAVRLYPRDEERQDAAVTEFWSQLLVSEGSSPPVLARYDGQRPLAPWLIRVFQNQHLSRLRPKAGPVALPDDDLAMPMPAREATEGRWHESFTLAAREWLGTLSDQELILLGLRWRHRMSQREVAGLIGIHEGNVSRRTEKLREGFLGRVEAALRSAGWSGENLQDYVLKEMDSVLLDDPRLSADHLAGLLRGRGRPLPPSDRPGRGSEP